jgi:hypothetical protein
MRWTTTAAAGFLGIGLALGADGAGAPAEAGEPGVESGPLEQLMEKHPPINLDTVNDIVLGLPTRKLDDLAADGARLDGMHYLVMKKWRAIQHARWSHMRLTQEVVFQAAATTMALFRIEDERKAKLAAILERQNAEFRTLYGRQFGSIKEAEDAARAFEGTPEYRKYEDERDAVQKWYRAAYEEEKRKARTGQTPAMDKIDELTQEAQTEIQTIGRARRAVAKQIEKKKAQGPEAPEEPKPTEEELEERRAELHLAAIRTEYEARTGEPVECLFQVWKGRKPYAVYTHVQGSKEPLREQFVHDPGEFTVLFAFPKPGTYTGVVHATDQMGTDKKATVTITVTGNPVPDEKPKKPADPKGAGGTGGAGAGGGSPGPGTAPLQGTFQAVLYGGTAQLARPDLVGFENFHAQGAPMTLSIAGDGTLSATVRYALPKEEVKPLPPLNPGETPMQNVFWKTSFDLAGRVDWATGKTTISIRNGHDERGYEKDVPEFGSDGKKKGMAHWRDWTKSDYSMELEGWTIPGPQASAWLSTLDASSEVGAMLKQMDLETVGMPSVVPGPGNTFTYRDRGFGGMPGLDRKPPPDGLNARRRTYRLYLSHIGYDGKNETETDDTKKRQDEAAKEAAGRAGAWYLKLLGVAPAVAEAPPPAAEPKDDDVLAFGLWPVKPITVVAGSNMSARAMAVFGKDVNEAVDLSSRATWTASPGLVLLKDGSFSAPTPGTYTLTATFSSPAGPMSSTIQVVVTGK